MFIIDNVQLNLDTNKGYQWCHSEKAWIKGYCYLDNVLYKNEKLLELYDNVNTLNEVIDLLKNVDGFFSIIIKLKEGILFAVDHVRSMPLFYYIGDNGIIISDNLNKQLITKYELDINNLQQYQTSLFTIDSNTLLQNVNQVCAGEYIFIENNGNIHRNIYWKYEYNNILQSDTKKSIIIIKNAYEESFNRLIELLNGRTAVIPLSGGHDSRLIVFYLNKLGYKNIICYTYGELNNNESIISKKVSDYYGLKNYFIEYKRSQINKKYKKLYQEFLLFAGNCVSVPCIQEWYAVIWLLENNIINNNSVIIPGYSGDFLAGSHLISSFINNEEYEKTTLIDDIIYKHFTESKWYKYNPNYREDLHKLINNIEYFNILEEKLTVEKAAEIYERFDLNERQGKFIQNAVRTYEFCGLEWITPFFDRIQFQTWLSISNIIRFDRKLFYEFEKYIYSKDFYNIGFNEKANDSVRNNIFLKYLKRLRFINPSNIHYLFSYYSLFTYYINIYKTKQANINQLVSNKYISIINNLVNKK